jgi:hypothetical protein
VLNNWRWFSVKDGDAMLVDLFRRHYSSPKKSASVYRKYGFSGQGESMALCTVVGDAGFMWVKQGIRDDGQTGINCTFFRNESKELSSSLILEAEGLALNKWPDTKRFFTYVDPRKVRHKRDPGRCFFRAGWKKIGITKVNKLLILEKIIEKG